MHPLLALPCRCRQPCRASGNLCALCRERRGRRRSPALVLMIRPDKSALPWLWLSLLVVVLDAASQQWALAQLQLHQPVPIIPGLLNWTLVYNYGAAFSFLADHSGWQRWLFSALAIGSRRSE